MSERILLVEDEVAIADAVAYSLRGDGFVVEAAGDGETALALARDGGYDLIVLDVMLPGISGLEVCRQVRETSPVPILMLTARTSEGDRVLGLESGADDYVVKPFSVPELISRVRAILRRRRLDRADGESPISVAGLVLRADRHSVTLEGREIRLTPSEFRILSLLASQPGRVFGRADLVRHLWDTAHVPSRRVVDAHVANLRRKIERDHARPERLLTIRGLGYTLAPSVKKPAQKPR